MDFIIVTHFIGRKNGKTIEVVGGNPNSTIIAKSLRKF